MDFVNLNFYQMTRTTLELPPFSKRPHNSKGGYLHLDVRFDMQRIQTYHSSSLEACFEPGTLLMLRLYHSAIVASSNAQQQRRTFAPRRQI
ncbi:hypothetical protein AVEN_58426-1 [Araneus ventricosus]|uniref:Uncharacterized protein n=1 Tax=Araneus ventricosus TaxID=182803 RepID=A0A4Y2N3B4_ARAVE|nr:hypothetical protein AVEN_58426-1 [Araneus ventricosus]